MKINQNMAGEGYVIWIRDATGSNFEDIAALQADPKTAAALFNFLEAANPGQMMMTVYQPTGRQYVSKKSARKARYG